jgi:hypothetical protein
MVDGLGQMPIEASLPGAFPVPVLPVAGQGNEERRGHTGELPQLRGDLVPALARQADV